MEWLNAQVKNVTNTVAGPPVDPNTCQPVMQNGQPQEKKPWWKFGFGGARKKPKKTKKPKSKMKKTKRK